MLDFFCTPVCLFLTGGEQSCTQHSRCESKAQNKEGILGPDIGTMTSIFAGKSKMFLYM